MATINGTRDIVDALISGRTNTYTFRKTPSQATTAGRWFDLALSPGNPPPKYWFGTPLQATPITQSADGGFFHGSDVSPSEKYLYKTVVMSNSTSLFRVAHLLDYVMYYPLIDDGSTDEQVMDNTQTLPRYTDGQGLQMMAISVAARTGGQSFFVNYTNQDGVAGRITPNVVQNTSSALGVVVTHNSQVAGNTPLFIPLQQGDTGVRSIESVTMNGADVGLFSIVLVKQLSSTGVQEQTAPQEVNHVYEKQNLARIYPDAYLNFVVYPNTTLSAITFLVDVQTIWSP